MRHRSIVVVGVVMAAVALVGVNASVVASTAQPQEEFVPIDQLPPDDQLPAAPLLIAAYGIVWVVVFVYLWSIRRRQDRIERELSDLSKRAGGGGEQTP